MEHNEAPELNPFVLTVAALVIVLVAGYQRRKGLAPDSSTPS